MNKFILSVLLGSFCMSSVAGGKWSTSLGEVESVISHNGNTIIQTTINVNNCGMAGKFWWSTQEEVDSDEMLAISLAAFTSGNKVSVVHQTDANDALCNYGGERINKIKISK